MRSTSRRDFLRASSALPFLLSGSSLFAHEEDPRFPGLIVRNTEPKNLEFPFSFLKDKITPNEQFFVRSHFAIPVISTEKWSLSVEGAVKQKGTLNYDQLLKLPSTTITATLECAGNGRVFLKPSVGGLQWGMGGISTAKWKGVSLFKLLENAGVKEGAVEILLEGTDKGQINTDPKSPGPIHFGRSIPLSKAIQHGTILAYEMNDRPLPEEHGGPVRAIIPGWFGVASVKWVKRLIVLNQVHQGFWQTLDYAIWQRREEVPSLIPVTELQVKSSIARPALNEVIPPGSKQKIFGAAWTGDSKIKKVEVSTDNGQTWNIAKLQSDPEKYVWTLWEYDWQVPNQKGIMKLLSRATDERGQTQPVERDIDRRTYMINHLVPVEVVVR